MQSSEWYLTAACHTANRKPEPIDISQYYSVTTKNRHSTFIKDFYKYFRIPGIGNLGGGLPNYKYFPFNTLEASVTLPNGLNPSTHILDSSGFTGLSTGGPNDDAATSRVVVPKSIKTDDILRKIDLKSALQYGTSQGYAPLYSFLRQFALQNMHPNVPYKDGPEIILTAGATDGFSKSIEALSNVWSSRDGISRKEGLIVEEIAYTLPFQAARARGLNIIPVAVDDQGMCASGTGGLQDVLDQWDYTRGKRPHLIYTVTFDFARLLTV